MSCLEQMSFDKGEAAVAMSLSVFASVQCCIVISGVGEPALIIFISQRPALRIGISAAPASSAGSDASRQDPRQNERSCRFMLRLPVKLRRREDGSAQ